MLKVQVNLSLSIVTSGTISTDGSSVDNKSSTPRADSDILAAVAATSPAKSWGSGSSFAKILKTQETLMNNLDTH